MAEQSCVQPVCTQIKEQFDVEKIFVFHVKQNAQTVTSFKICVITQSDDPYQLEHDIYLGVDCEIPFDVVAYTVSQWEHLHIQPTSFARQIEHGGECLYVRTDK